jgi:hypothetical protein
LKSLQVTNSDYKENIVNMAPVGRLEFGQEGVVLDKLRRHKNVKHIATHCID